MIWTPRNILRLAIISILLGTAACSKEPASDGDPVEKASTADVIAFFKQGFEDASRPEPELLVVRETTYEPDPDVRGKVNRQFADSLRRNFSIEFAMPDPKQFLRSGAASDIADRKIEALGLPAHDLGSATVLMFGLAWELANGQKLTADRQKALLREVDRKLKEKPIRQSQRQIEAEYRLLTAAIWIEEARLRGGSPDQMRALSDAVQRDMKRMTGNDMRAHDVTDAGFVER